MLEERLSWACGCNCQALRSVPCLERFACGLDGVCACAAWLDCPIWCGYAVRISPASSSAMERSIPLLTPVIKAIWREAVCVVAKCAGEAEMIHAVDAARAGNPGAQWR